MSRRCVALVLALWLMPVVAARGAEPPTQPAPATQPAEPAQPAQPDQAPEPAEPSQPAEPGGQPVIVPPRALGEARADYPPEALEAGVEADVVLQLDVLADGTVGEVSVKEPAGQGFDEAAVAAVKTLRFEPATVDGVPTPVRITYTYRFRIEQRVTPPEPEPEPARVLIARGDVRERGTRKRLAGVAVVLDETGESFLTDERGRFEIYGPGPGRYTLEVPLDAYEPYRETFEVAEGGVADVEMRLTRDVYSDFRTVVKRPRIEKEVAKRSLSGAEIQKIPGTSGDSVKVVQLLPGVARGAFGTGDPIIRGSSPEDSLTFLSGMRLPTLFHFGGVYSVFNTDLIDTVDYWPGGFSARYGQATGGIINVTLRPLRTDRWHGSLETNVFHAGVLVEGPVGDRTAVALAARRSYIDALLPAVLSSDTLDLTVAPRYYDYQARVTHRISAKSDLWLMAYGSDDELVFILKEPAGPSGIFGGKLRSKSFFHLLNGEWRRELTPKSELRLSFSGGYQRFLVDAGAGFALDVRLVPVNMRLETEWQISKDFILNAGFDGTVAPYDISYHGDQIPKEGDSTQVFDPSDFVRVDVTGTLRSIGPYLEGTLRLADKLTLVPGIRLDAISTGKSSVTTVDPRLSVRWQVAEKTVLKAFGGLYHRPPDFDEWDATLGNSKLGAERATQIAVGVEQKLSSLITADLQVFAKFMDNLVVSRDPVDDGVNYSNEGVGRVYGLEVLLRHDPGRRFFGWVSYTLMRARRKDGSGPDYEWRPFDFDQTHILNLVGVYRLGRGWEAGVRFRYTTGNPQTPIIGSVFDSDTDTYFPIPGVTNSDRQGAFHQLDVRIDKKWVFDSWMLNLYLEVQNVYNRANPEGLNYSFDYAEKQTLKGLPIIPNFGIKAEF
ncbi:MAG: TonB-dependent receptor [Deltaproteobacteria bacterium]|nr:TonB-dependent receptor [Deltaproteobacteria bacterium]